jgi:hypothetical protein
MLSAPLVELLQVTCCSSKSTLLLLLLLLLLLTLLLLPTLLLLLLVQVSAMELDSLTPDLPQLLLELGINYDPDRLAAHLSKQWPKVGGWVAECCVGLCVVSVWVGQHKGVQQGQWHVKTSRKRVKHNDVSSVVLFAHQYHRAATLPTTCCRRCMAVRCASLPA